MIMFDEDFAGPGDWAKLYRSVGIQVVPAYHPDPRNSGFQWKRPLLKEWRSYQNELVPAFTFERWYGAQGEHMARSNMGIVTGRCSGNIGVVDLDIQKTPAAAYWWKELTRQHMEPETWRQTTGGGGVQILFRFPADFVIPTIKTAIGVDIRGQGGFAMLPPSKHESGRAYDWQRGFGPHEIPIEDAPLWLCEAILQLAEEHGGTPIGTRERTASAGSYDDFGRQTDGREEKMANLIWARLIDLYRECPIPPPESEAADAFAAYERNTKTRLDGVANADGLEREGRGLSEFLRKWRKALEKWQTDIAAEAGQPKPEKPNEPTGKANILPFTVWDDVAEEQIPLRPWLVPGLLIRQHVTLLVAPGAAGKSLFTLQVGMAAALKQRFGRFFPACETKTLFINSEDDRDEMNRRRAAARRAMRITPSSLAARLHIAADDDAPKIIRIEPRTNEVVRYPLYDQIVAYVKENAIDLIVVDPFVETFDGNENDNMHINRAAGAWRDIARKTNAAVLLVHHTKKYASDMAGDADAGRGASAGNNVARLSLTLFPMSADEAEKFEIEPQERHRFVRLDDAKMNLKLINGEADWFQKHTVKLANGSQLVDGDEVGALLPWEPPSAFEGVPADRLKAALRLIERGLMDDDGEPSGSRFSAHKNARKRSVMPVVAGAVGKAEDAAQRIVQAWLKAGILIEEPYVNQARRHEESGLRVEWSKCTL
jgi:hypothetical protein